MISNIPSDPVKLINILNNVGDIPWHMKNIISDCLHLANIVNVVTFSNVPRHIPHTLATLLVDQGILFKIDNIMRLRTFKCEKP